MAFPVSAAVSAAAGTGAASGGGFPAGVIGPALGLAGRLFGGSSGPKAADVWSWNYQAQKEFAKHGIRWKVEDAKAAGLHPLFALGGAGALYSPSAVSVPGSDSIGSGFSEFGQNIGRAIDATRTKPERAEVRMQAIAMERGELENDLLRAQIALTNAPQVPPARPVVADGPPIPLAGQGDVPAGAVAVPAQNVGTEVGLPSHRAGANPETMWVRTDKGWAPNPAPESYEDPGIESPTSYGWYARNLFLPSVGVRGNPPPDRLLPEGAIGWRWHPFAMEYRPAFKKRISEHFANPWNRFTGRR